MRSAQPQAVGKRVDTLRGVGPSPRSKNRRRPKRGSGTDRPGRWRPPKRGWPLVLWLAKWSAVTGLALAALGAVMMAVLFWYYGRDLPSIASLSEYRPMQVTRIASSDGTVIGELYEERRTFVSIDEVPPLVINAFVSAEDESFFEHGGIDYWGMFRALLVNLRAGEKKQGASTITQQVVKTLLLTPERTFRRKFQEIILARRLDEALSKSEILSLYLNQIYFGHGRYGVEEACRFYFGKSVRELDVGQAAMIAGLPKSPERLSPRKPENAGRAKSRQRYVLQQMAANGYISADDARHWIEAPLEVLAEPFPDLNVAPEWVELVRRDLVERYGEAAVPTLGTTVRTTLDLDMQKRALAALRRGLRAVDERQGYGQPIERIKSDKLDLYRAKLARRLPKAGPKGGETYRAVVLEVHDAERGQPGELVVDLGEWKGSVLLSGESDGRFNPDGKPASKRFAVGDVIRVEREAEPDLKPRFSERALALAPGPEGAVVVLDPRTRRVLALVGGYGSRVAGFDRATMARRQAGSSFKPFVYAAAIDSGAFTAASVVNDAPEVYDLWKPENYTKGEFEGPVRLRHALAKSINTVAIRVMNEVGPARVAALAAAMGIRSELPEELSLALGSGEVTPIEMTNAFATLAAGGWAAPPRFIEQIGDQTQAVGEPLQALRPEVAYVVADMMKSVINEGTGVRARKLNLGIAGKTGTTNDARDAWFIGFTNELVVGIWVGFDEPSSLGRREGGSRTALPIFVDLLQGLGNRARRASFERPPGVVDARIDKKAGLLAPVGASDDSAYTEVFLEGSAPVEVAPTAQEVDVDSFVLEQYGEQGADAGAEPSELGLEGLE